jgi:hypothetical protein
MSQVSSWSTSQLTSQPSPHNSTHNSPHNPHLTTHLTTLTSQLNSQLTSQPSPHNSTHNSQLNSTQLNSLDSTQLSILSICNSVGDSGAWHLLGRILLGQVRERSLPVFAALVLLGFAPPTPPHPTGSCAFSLVLLFRGIVFLHFLRTRVCAVAAITSFYLPV